MEIKDRVLIVEDDKNIRKFIQTILEANDYDVIATETEIGRASCRERVLRLV